MLNPLPIKKSQICLAFLALSPLTAPLDPLLLEELPPSPKLMAFSNIDATLLKAPKNVLTSFLSPDEEDDPFLALPGSTLPNLEVSINLALGGEEGISLRAFLIPLAYSSTDAPKYPLCFNL